MKSIWQFSRGTKISTRKFKKRNETKGDIWYLDRKIWLPVCNIEHMRRDHPWRGRGGEAASTCSRGMKTATGTNAERRSIPRRRGTRVQTDKNAWPPVFSPLPPPSFALESVVQQTEAAFPLQLAPKKKRSVWKKGHVHCNRLSSLFFPFLFFSSLAEFSK